MLALSIRQPYAELILRGVKTIEYRSRATRVIGQRFHIYAARSKANLPVWSEDLGMAAPPRWLIELARQVKTIPPDIYLPTGVIVGSAVIDRCELIDVDDRIGRANPDGSCPLSNRPVPTPIHAWHLTDVRRSNTLRKPDRRPQPVWFRAF